MNNGPVEELKVTRFLEGPNVRYELSKPSIVMVVVPDINCPACHARGFRRHGVYFDHEWRCGACDLSWEPGNTYLLIEQTITK